MYSGYNPRDYVARVTQPPQTPPCMSMGGGGVATVGPGSMVGPRPHQITRAHAHSNLVGMSPYFPFGAQCVACPAWLLRGGGGHEKHSNLNLQCSCCVVCKHLFISQGHLKWTKTASPSLRPVSLTLDLPSLLQVGDHDNGGRSLQPPEVHQSRGQRT